MGWEIHSRLAVNEDPTLEPSEITSRDESNARTRLRLARVPGHQDTPELRRRSLLDPVRAVRLPRVTGVGACRGEPRLIGPAGAWKSHMLVALGIAAVEAGRRVQYFTAAELIERYDIAGSVTDAVAVASLLGPDLGQHLNATSRVTHLRAQRPH